ncbi:uncharacterized protein LOC119737562 [Patiria miniata]|uniref:Ig-like domain-containing protein n=1 Tax=Patiria miniata TaxID=46514 RepID=A0A914AXE9_PATMI|nr:uncharacterized protein LOC119737562 [Patiria miniata]
MTRRVENRMQRVPSSLLLYCICTLVQAVTVEALFLERGHRGIVPCPMSISCKKLVKDVDAMYWFYGSLSDTFLLISYFKGRVAPQNGIPEGVYDIDDECNLIIENVTASNAGTYFYKLKPRFKSTTEGQIEVRDKVSPSRPYPTVIDCNQDHDADMCEVRVRHDSTVYNLTCIMEQVKPAVELKWFLGGLTEFKASTADRPVVLPANTGLWLRNNTYSTSATIQVPSDDNDIEYVCEAMGDVAVGRSTTRTRVRLTKTKPTTATYDEVQSSSNPGTTLALTDSIPIPNKPVDLSVIWAVVASIVFIGFVAACVYIVYLKKKQREFIRAETCAYEPPDLSMTCLWAFTPGCPFSCYNFRQNDF